MGFRVWGSGFGVWGFGVWGLGFAVEGSASRVPGLELGVYLPHLEAPKTLKFSPDTLNPDPKP